MKNVLYGFLLAMQFLTRIPVPIECPWTIKTSRWAIRFYPIVGLVMGVVLVVVGSSLSPFLPSGLLALILVSLWVWLTGGLHLDGVMDVADAVGSNAPLEKKWTIMKDPHVGSFGIITLVFLLGWKTMLIYLLLTQADWHVIIPFMLSVASARLSAVGLLIFLPAAKKEGLAWHWKKNLNWLDSVWAGMPIVLVIGFFPHLSWLLILFLLMTGLYGFWLMRTFKGVNGDLTGAAIEGGELWGLLLIWIFTSFVTG
ncbi:adenosylcobinamide-GDP ribazoletransferase [Salipaludibacillus agaradhaerens]|uniref:Adenosylcobinamide-GDP ribazoletransferase n=1 Tax=Salipaludibacillus agaradhaerens TaxID=76935 RepID=A0A9Q4FZT4_SALAG|nr:adenosylcobinamide-GDP ribazoletransferase [Salipaludibacillus agaradhaerens]MCR6097412.1 adenosylcobinamide-GDP ribazoletransferase [Salipaludibacillus agaradhaerens]MCR6113104.1 adenosylcobinamide-GDP ribazoletransferase [Salipaludibacillus agaradhaerens]